MKEDRIFQFIQYPLDLEDNFSKVDLTKPEYLVMFYSWIEVKTELTRLLGRNTLYTILRLYGFTDRFNRPKMEHSKDNFRWISPRQKRKWKIYYPGRGNIYITGYALASVIKLISYYRRMIG